jgi:hypothetical protein
LVLRFKDFSGAGTDHRAAKARAGSFDRAFDAEMPGFAVDETG